jgi:4-carboxymuconolactone decarboxylase
MIARRRLRSSGANAFESEIGATALTAKPPASAARERFGDLAPQLVDLTERIVLGELWQGEGMSKRDRSLIILSALVALNCTEQLGPYMR